MSLVLSFLFMRLIANVLGPLLVQDFHLIEKMAYFNR